MRPLNVWLVDKLAALTHMSEDVLDATNMRTNAGLPDVLVALFLPSLHLNKLLLRATQSSWPFQASVSTLDIIHNGVN